MASLRDDDELERILHPVRNEDYMQRYAMKQVKVLRAALVDVEEGTAVSVAEREYWQEIESLNRWLTDQRGSLEWYTLTEGDLVRMCTDDDPLPFFTSVENDAILCRRYGIDRAVDSLRGMFKESFHFARGHPYDASIHTPDTVAQITRTEHDLVIEQEHRSGFTRIIADSTGTSLPEAQVILDSRRLLGYLSRDDTDVAPKIVLFAYDENWNLMYTGPVFDGYTSQSLFVPLTPDHEAYDHVLDYLKEDMAIRCGLTLREGWPKP